MADDGELVESGTFRVDRKKALEKLKAFQLPDPTMFILSWVRCAVASGATEITIQINDAKTHLTMSFDGRPFGEGELKDPYGCLLDESTPENARNRHLAVGILAALRLGPPMKLMVTSGTDSERRCLYIDSLEREDLGKTRWFSHMTVLEATFSGYWVHWKAALETVVRQYPVEMRAARLKVIEPAGLQAKTESEIPQQGQSLKLAFSDDAVRGSVAVPENPDQAQSTVRLYQHGVLVEEFESDLAPVPVVAAINNDRFRFNASQSGVVRDDQFEATMQAVSDLPGRLLAQVCQAQGKTLAAYDALRFRSVSMISSLLAKFGPFVGSLSLSVLALTASKWIAKSSYAGSDLELFADAVSFFSFLFAMTGGFIFMALENPTEERRGQLMRMLPIRGASQVTSWLRKACTTLLHDYHSDSADPVRKTLWEVPIFLNALDGPPFSLAELKIQRQQLGHVSFSTEPGLHKSSPHKVVWCVNEGDQHDLYRLCEGPLVDETDAVQKERGNG